MKKYLIIFFVLLSISIQINAQSVSSQPDPAIKQMVEEVSAQNLETIVRKLASFETRHSLSTTKSATKGIGAARNWVESEFKKYAQASNGRLQVVQDPYILEPDGRRVTRRVEMRNVMATLKGTNPNDTRVFIISGHLDSRNTDIMDSTGRAPGANDDASGVAIVMELARIMAKKEFPCTIVFVAVQGEEQGLLGAKHLADRAKKENWNITGMITNDIIGNSLSDETNIRDNTHVRVFSEGVPAYETEEMTKLRKSIFSENDSPSRQFARYIKEAGEKYVDQMQVELIYRSDRFLRGGDHTPFSQNGFTAVRMTEMNENFQQQHQNVRTENGIQYGDLPEFVDYQYLKKNAAVNLATLASLALAPSAPEQVGIVTSNLTNKTTLKWQASAVGEKPAGYYVLMRETHSPVWTKKVFVNSTETTLPYSKDNFLFAVQAVDAEGHESLPVIPAPVR
ncbi:M28 family metallopeptidase [Rhodocytophaga aerolata]|uniref:M28 family metallopeptidase n=1 Tax=Rhodocytophaga aerolata TaxID=455078 RepID=A0ABT8R4U1_9BACT|nr:M28 family metallopeptidase [Rhodocytophaga aerolata]MDO1447110.1 M28 family metallopeptidase [Rhodocytophaga aerolata]